MKFHALRSLTILIAILCAVMAGPVRAQNQDESAREEAREENAEAIQLSSPRATMQWFLSHMNAEVNNDRGRWLEAARALDLDHVSRASYQTVARDAAFQLYDVINRIEYVVIESLPREWDTPIFVWRRLQAGPIEMTLDDKGNWRFSRSTIERLPQFLLELRDADLVEGEGIRGIEFSASPSAWFRTNLPRWFFNQTFILENFQWIGLLVVILVGLILDRLVRGLLHLAVRRRLLQQRVSYQMEHLEAMSKWVGICAGAIFWVVGLGWLGLPSGMYYMLRLAAVFVAVTSGVVGALRLVDLVCGTLQIRAEKTENTFDDLLVPLLRKALKIFVGAFGLVFIADNLDINIASVLAGLGLGGLAVALAAKDTVENLFGSITVLLDRPFKIGDWINVDGIDGTVESIGLRSTRLRTFYNSLVTVPNSNLIKANVDNYGARRYRRIRTMISVTYNTPPERIEAFCEGIQELLRIHPYTRKDSYMVWLNEFGPHSLDILLYCFVETPDWATELRERHRLFTDIIRLAKRIGVEFAFPTQTLYLERGAGPAKPDPQPFRDFREVLDEKSKARSGAKEILNRLHKGAGMPYPPPPVTFDAPVDPMDADIPLANRGGDDSGGDGGGR